MAREAAMMRLWKAWAC